MQSIPLINFSVRVHFYRSNIVSTVVTFFEFLVKYFYFIIHTWFHRKIYLWGTLIITRLVCWCLLPDFFNRQRHISVSFLATSQVRPHILQTFSFVSLVTFEFVIFPVGSLLAPGFTIACTSKSLPGLYCTSFVIPLTWLSTSIKILFFSF